MSTFSDVETYRPVCILSFLSTAETDVLVPVLSQSTDGVVVSFVVVLKFPNVTIRTTKTVELVQLSGGVVSVVVVLKSESMGAPGRCATCHLSDFPETWPV